MGSAGLCRRGQGHRHRLLARQRTSLGELPADPVEQLLPDLLFGDRLQDGTRGQQRRRLPGVPVRRTGCDRLRRRPDRLAAQERQARRLPPRHGRDDEDAGRLRRCPVAGGPPCALVPEVAPRAGGRGGADRLGVLHRGFQGSREERGLRIRHRRRRGQQRRLSGPALADGEQRRWPVRQGPEPRRRHRRQHRSDGLRAGADRVGGRRPRRRELHRRQCLRAVDEQDRRHGLAHRRPAARAR